MAPRWVKKRDGRIEPYDEARIASGVMRAGRRAGSYEQVEELARQMASAVTLYLTESGQRAPETSQIASSVEAALVETGHGPIAQLVRDWREWRSRRQAEIRVREEGPSREEGGKDIEVLSLRAARPWTKRRIVKALEAEAELDQEAAEDVARAVEERVFAAGLNQISSNLLRELIDAELFERGFSAQLRRLEVLGVAKADLERMAFLGRGKAPLVLEDQVSRRALERFALDEIVHGPGAVAHRRGSIHLIGLERPFRLATGAVCAASLCDGATSALDAVGRLIRSTRSALASYDLMYGLVNPERAFAPFIDDPDTVRQAVELLLDALAVPYPDSVPPAPEIVLVVRKPPTDEAEQRTLDVLIQVLADRGRRAAGVRLLLCLPRSDSHFELLVIRLLDGARAGAGFDLALELGEPLVSRAMIPWHGTLQIGLINLASIALAAGRGGRERFSLGLREAVEAALGAFHQRRRRVFASVVKPSLPLFAGGGGDAQQEGELENAMGVVGLSASMRYLTGESPGENPQVAELAREVLLEIRTELNRVSARLGLGPVHLEDVPCGDAGLSLAALDLDRFPDARDLLGDDPGWDTGPGFGPPEAEDPYLDLRARLWLARKASCPLVLTRPLLAEVADPPGFVREVQRTLHNTSKILRRGAEASAE